VSKSVLEEEPSMNQRQGKPRLSMKWFRVYSEILDDHKMTELDDRQYRIMTLLMALASEEHKQGLIPLCLEKIAWRIRYSIEDVENTISKLKELRIVEDNGQGVQFINWKKRQFISDDNTKRWREWYEKKRKEKSNVGSNVGSNVADTDTYAYTDKRLSKDSLVNRTSVDGPISNCPHQEIVKLYHQILSELPRVKQWSDDRQKALRARWKEDAERQNLDWWKGFFRYVKECPFLMGQKTNFQASLPWLIKRGNFLKVIEGNYDEK
jgi:hypothetical protein